MMGLFDWVSEAVIDDTKRAGAVSIGWLLLDQRRGVLFDDPERFRSVETNMAHAKSASRCPAVLNLETRYFVIKCPITLHLGFERDAAGKPVLKNKLGDKSPIRKNKLDELITLVPEPEWRYRERPTIQIKTPYLFVCDEPAYITQTPPFMHYLQTPWPGTLFGGRFPIHVWPRPLMWAFEWWDTSKDLVLRRGDPWFYVGFEVTPPDRPVNLVEAEMTPDLEDYTAQISGAVNYVQQTYALFKTAEKRRPQKLLKVKD